MTTTKDSPYDRVTFRGVTVNKWTRQRLMAVEKRLGYTLTLSQGSYNGGANAVSASAGTHDGGGAVDLAPFDADHKVHALRCEGFAAWHRFPIPGVWPEHVHAILLGDEDASQGAKNQMADYRNHLDGLAGSAHDATWHPNPIVVKPYVPASKVKTVVQLGRHQILLGVKQLRSTSVNRPLVEKQARIIRQALRDMPKK